MRRTITSGNSWWGTSGPKSEETFDLEKRLKSIERMTQELVKFPGTYIGPYGTQIRDVDISQLPTSRLDLKRCPISPYFSFISEPRTMTRRTKCTKILWTRSKIQRSSFWSSLKVLCRALVVQTEASSIPPHVTLGLDPRGLHFSPASASAEPSGRAHWCPV